MNVHFIDRDGELEALEALAREKSSALVLLYGRRRVGKTRLVQEFMKDKPSLYFYVPNAEEKTILGEFSRVVEADFFKGFRFSDFGTFVEYLSKKCSEGVILAIDEFQRLSNVKGAISLLQKYWDERMSKDNCFVILSGSSVGAVHRVALSGDAPLYGRRTATLKLEPLKFLDLFDWFGDLPADELVKIYGSFGGTPAYLEHLDNSLGVETNIVEKILDRRSALHDEPEMLLMQEIRAPHRYMDILTALAMGKNRISQIADAAGLSRENSTTYLKTLEILDLIERITPATEPDAKRGLYRIKDPFFLFWFRFVRPNKRQLELGLERNVWEDVKEEFNEHLGRVFERIWLEVLVEMARKDLLPIRPHRMGKWWWKETEIDLLGLERKGRRAMALEVKWTELSHTEAKRVLAGLSKKVQEIKGIEESVLGLIGRSIEGKEKLRREGFITLDLHDIKGRKRLPNLSDFTQPQI